MINTQKGSITVEAIVMLGLIATLTPILYKHVADRRQDIENINEANTLLLLKNAVGEYIEENKESITSGVLSPADIGIDISGYQIGIRKDSSGNIDAMITGTGGTGNDMKAAKVASLLGVSAGIYSAQDSARAWGINGVWAEDISNYGFSSLPTGIPVITTAYDEENKSMLDMEEIFSAIEEHEFAKLKSERISAQEICFGDDCRTEWPKDFYRSCEDVKEVMEGKGGLPITGVYKIFEQEKACLFKANGDLYTKKEILDACANGSPELSCRAAYEGSLNRTCQQYKENYGSSLSNGSYKLTLYGYEGGNVRNFNCDMGKTPALTELLRGVDGSITAPVSGKYFFAVAGGGGGRGTCTTSYCTSMGAPGGAGGSGGIASGNKEYNSGTVFYIDTRNGGLCNADDLINCSGIGGKGIAIYVNGKSSYNNIIIAAGGGGGGGISTLGFNGGCGGGGYGGGGGGSGYNFDSTPVTRGLGGKGFKNDGGNSVVPATSNGVSGIGAEGGGNGGCGSNGGTALGGSGSGGGGGGDKCTAGGWGGGKIGGNGSGRCSELTVCSYTASTFPYNMNSKNSSANCYAIAPEAGVYLME